MQIIRLEDGSLFLNQNAYARKILKKYRMSECNAVTTPCEGMSNKDHEEGLVDDEVPYRQAVGSLMYLMMATRPDIFYAVSVVAESLEKPSVTNWKAVKRILKYLKGTLDYGLLYRAEFKLKELEAYCDADYGGDLNTRRSRTGIVCKYSAGAITWASQKQKSVVLSTTEAEYVAASEGTKEVIWLIRLLNEFAQHSEYIPTLRVDNASAIKLAKNPEFHKRSKHIEMRYHFVREKYQEGVIKIEHIDGQKQIADIMTKPLPRIRFEILRNLLGVIRLEEEE
ncbi:hypothetical protein JTB14_002372 [Gonioctena quinquepunctata]|nr:hypothetical protein JTB14_002372 [Gonioctena quinquepunctata]